DLVLFGQLLLVLLAVLADLVHLALGLDGVPGAALELAVADAEAALVLGRAVRRLVLVAGPEIRLEVALLDADFRRRTPRLLVFAIAGLDGAAGLQSAALALFVLGADAGRRLGGDLRFAFADGFLVGLGIPGAIAAGALRARQLLFVDGGLVAVDG